MFSLIGQPRTPPRLFTASAATVVASRTAVPFCDAGPVTLVITSTSIGQSCCAGAPVATPAAVATPTATAQAATMDPLILLMRLIPPSTESIRARKIFGAMLARKIFPKQCAPVVDAAGR